VDSVEVAVKLTEAIMSKSNPGRGSNLVEAYVSTFAEVLKRVNDVMAPPPEEPPASRLPRATSEIFPLSHDR
jgi:hypothetical protein